MLTPGYKKALEILRDNGPQWPDDFAGLMWPGKEWAKSSYGGPSRGAKAANWLLGKLDQRGWVRRDCEEYRDGEKKK